MKTRFLTAGVLVLLLAGPAYPAGQERLILQLQNDMVRVQQQMNQLQTSLDEKNAVLKGLVEKMADQINSLTGNMSRISQAMDNVKSQSDKSSSEFRTVLTEINRNVGEMHEGLSAVRSQINSLAQQVTTMKTTTEPLERPEDLLRTAAADVSAGNYDLAISGYKDFLAKYSSHPRAIEAELAIGNALYAQKQFEPAIIQYDLVLQKYPESDKKRSALYFKGLAHAELNQIPQAIQALDAVAKQYPETIEGANAKAKVAALRGRPRQ